MCGLNFILDKKSSLSSDFIQRMNEATRHRGPEATAFYTHRSGGHTWYFGHNRLKILDCSDAANQPFFSADKRYLLLYNGEIYNYRQLRQALQQSGHTFRTGSDTEVLLHLLIQKGAEALPELNGMFALLFFDTATNKLLVARDRFGLKPLYFANTSEVLIISSEIKGILASGLVPKELNEQQLAHYLTFKYARKPQTFFRHISEVAEGTAGTLTEQTDQLSFLKYCQDVSVREPGMQTDTEILQRTEQLLQQSLEVKLQADVPVGLFLSGGVDSTLLLAELAAAGHRHFPVFSVVNKAAERTFGSDDYYYAREAARQFGAEHHVFELDRAILKSFPDLAADADQPIADGAALLTSFLSEKARQHVKVALSGAGADELFAGYNRHRAFYNYLANRKMLLLAKPFLQAAAPFLPTGTANPWRRQFRLVRKLATKIHAGPELTFRQFTSMEPELRDLLQQQPDTFFPAEQGHFPDNSSALEWALHHDQHEYLISDILMLTDKTSMQHSLEVRTPYLDNELQQFLTNLAPELLFKNGQKWILKELLRRHNGEKYLRRAKEGFGMPLGLWLKEPANEWLLAPLRERKSLLFNYLDFEKTQKLLLMHLQSKHDLSVEIWALLTLAYWLQKNFS